MRSLRLAACVAAIALLVAPTAGAATHTHGMFETLPEGTNLGLEIRGVAQLLRTDDATYAMVTVRGLVPGTIYASHLHNAPCAAPALGGGHYRDDPAGPAMPPNELWLSSSDDPMGGILANAAGVAIGFGSADWVARSDAQSIVIHNIPPGGTTAGGPKIACADLS